MTYQLATISYATAASAYVALAVLIAVKWRARVRGTLLLAAVIASIIWAALLAYYGSRSNVPIVFMYLTEVAHDSAWLIFMSSLLSGAVAAESNWIVRRGGVVLGLGLFVIGAILGFLNSTNQYLTALSQLLIIGSIATSLFVLVGIEQLYRNARRSQQNGLKFLCLGLAGTFAFDIFLYSNAVIDGEIQAKYWTARGFVVAISAPLLAISVSRVTSWSGGFFASRKIVFYTTTLIAAGAYLSLVGLGGYYIKIWNKNWSDSLQLVFFFAAVLGFLVLILSEQLRGKFRVLLTKHFFERKYDYRAEWHRLIETLTGVEDKLPLRKRTIKAMAQIIGSPSGHLWLKNEDGTKLIAVANWDTQPIDTGISLTDNFIEFVRSTRWIIDVAEIKIKPAKYDPLRWSELSPDIQAAAYAIPVFHDSKLLGLITLAKPSTPLNLNFEDHDLLKTVGQEVGGFLAQENATELLAESRQFEAYNKFTAFIMHDLKNAIAQQSLVVENAERHKRNPEFIDDAIETIKGSVARMQKVLQQLSQQSAVAPNTERIDVTKLILKAESQCADRAPKPVATMPKETVYVQANYERLLSCVLHAIRNAQDACDPDGRVALSVRIDSDSCYVDIEDNGCGMDSTFIQERLFRPFDSTKGAGGMGIGAYQIRETVRAIGGDINMASAVGSGSILTLRLPLSQPVT